MHHKCEGSPQHHKQLWTPIDSSGTTSKNCKLKLPLGCLTSKKNVLNGQNTPYLTVRTIFPPGGRVAIISLRRFLRAQRQGGYSISYGRTERLEF